MDNNTNSNNNKIRLHCSVCKGKISEKLHHFCWALPKYIFDLKKLLWQADLSNRVCWKCFFLCDLVFEKAKDLDMQKAVLFIQKNKLKTNHNCHGTILSLTIKKTHIELFRLVATRAPILKLFLSAQFCCSVRRKSSVSR